jgi:hypothetical protein
MIAKSFVKSNSEILPGIMKIEIEKASNTYATQQKIAEGAVA